MSTTSERARAGEFRREMDDGRWKRQRNHFTRRLDDPATTVRPGRFRLYACLACPWAHRQLIVRAHKGFEDALPVTLVDPVRDERGWTFATTWDREDPHDPVGTHDLPPLPRDAWDGYGADPEGHDFLAEAYLASDPEFDGRVTVPAVWDRAEGVVVTNDFPVIDEQLNRVFDEWADHPEVDLQPDELRDDIAAWDDLIYHDVNNGVYKSGFATTQSAYDEAVTALFARLDHLEGHLADHRYLCGDRLTLADVRLFVTLVRFDAVYHHHFRCNRNKVAEMPNLWAYTRDLFQTRGFGDTVDMDHIRRHYELTHTTLNPSGILSVGPDPDFHAPHGRG